MFKKSAVDLNSAFYSQSAVCILHSVSPVFRGVYGDIFALFQACVGNFHPIRPWKVVGTLYLDSSFVTLKYCAVCSLQSAFYTDRFSFIVFKVHM